MTSRIGDAQSPLRTDSPRSQPEIMSNSGIVGVARPSSTRSAKNNDSKVTWENNVNDMLADEDYIKYGDTIKLFAISQYLKHQKTGSGVVQGGYVGVYEKPDGTARVACPPIGDNAEGTFKESILRIQHPWGEIPDGTVVKYGDLCVLVDEKGNVWNNKIGTGTFSGFFEGYLGPKPRGENGEVFISFSKNGHDRQPLQYAQNAVFIDVEASNRYRSAYNYRITNYKSSSSRIIGGYLCSDGTGQELPFTIHRHTGPPVRAYKLPAVVERRISRRLSSLKHHEHGGSFQFKAVGGAGSIFTPPRIEYVGVLRGDSQLDTMIKDPLYGKPIKLYKVRPGDTIIVKLEQEKAQARLSASHLFNAAENAAPHGSGSPLQLDIACQKDDSNIQSVASKTTKRVDLNSVEMIVEQDLTVLKRAFRTEYRNSGEFGEYDRGDLDKSDKLDKLDLLIACHKLAMVYFACAIVLPYFIWQIVLVLGDLLEPIHQLSAKNKSLAIIERILTTLVVDFGIEVVDGVAKIQDTHRNMETTTLLSSFIAFILVYALGLVTPGFARVGTKHRRKNKQGEDEHETANWLVSINVPENAWDYRKMSMEQARMASVSTRTEWEDDDSTNEDDGASFTSEETGDTCKVDGIRVGGVWGNAGVDEEGTPLHPAFKRFLAGEKGNLAAAKARWIRTCDWRVEGNIDTILEQPHQYYHVLKDNLPNYYMGRGKLGHPVYIDCPGGVKMKALRKAGVKLTDLLFHFTYSTEFLWNVIEPSQDGRTISILDLEGIGMFDFVGEATDFVKRTIALSSEHYPERARKIFIINAPRFFSGIWSVIKPWLDEETKKKIGLFRTGYTEALLEEIDVSVLPVKYGGKNETPLGSSDEDRLLESHVCRVLLEKKIPMLDGTGKPAAGSPENLDKFIDDSLKGGVSKLKLDTPQHAKLDT
uniref:CRAL-TRIO domain-containing protein n=1 Tax=Mucochytrium quahogii TaxID=96639 RepID=A0A7S2WJ12_9STRA|mmetsp:Transcript_74/g.169  ORF Transcript_74/g.169 Transcript_74/m.169 type:complete len:930 (+) Transcript_74:345-3134(+)|eukprot:CAMPEP_0203759262 /NCGR_PEP_ID=MMETSP0098-20131031/12210_1 /ASSEMBLY_ACC=CAM_ASM_000208 /TAXON_ID=96639 /ORGANISM=" , Strain NY0313808BC1" /LENGTH=929 /DNA_ID=CAMNT_0050652081 /DNA_START=304 /DNA_END=3093 /DNA_ORIENTATION=-